MTEYAYLAVGNPSYALANDWKPFFFKGENIQTELRDNLYFITWDDTENGDGAGEYMVPINSVLFWAKGDFLKPEYDEYKRNQREKAEVRDESR